jgi:hypothetical protein
VDYKLSALVSHKIVDGGYYAAQKASEGAYNEEDNPQSIPSFHSVDEHEKPEDKAKYQQDYQERTKTQDPTDKAHDNDLMKEVYKFDEKEIQIPRLRAGHLLSLKLLLND